MQKAKIGLKSNSATADAKPKLERNETLERDLHRYANWLAKIEPYSDRMQRFQVRYPRRFLALCKFHLSILVDLPVDFLDSRLKAAKPGTNNASLSSSSGNAKTSFDLSNSDCESGQGVKPTSGSGGRWPAWSARRKVPGSSNTGTVSTVCSAPRTRAACRRMVANTEATTGPASQSDSMRQQQWTMSNTHNRKASIPARLVDNLHLLMDFLDRDEFLKVEGIFRKTGNLLRQRELRRRIMQVDARPLAESDLTGCDVLRSAATSTRANAKVTDSNAIGSGNNTDASLTGRRQNLMNVHDLAATLKSVMYDLAEPLLTEEFLPIFCQVASFMTGRLDERGRRVHLRPAEERLARARQLKALRILHLLLPEPQRGLWRRLLLLLRRTLTFTTENRMTAESLGTMLGPLLLAPGKLSGRDDLQQYPSLAKLATLMIKQGCAGLFATPSSLANDVERNLCLVEKSRPKRDSLLNASDKPASAVSGGYGTAAPLIRTLSFDSGVSLFGSSGPQSEHGSCIDSLLPSDIKTAERSPSERASLVTLNDMTCGISDDDEEAGNDESPTLVTSVVFAKRSSLRRVNTETHNCLGSLPRPDQSTQKEQPSARLHGNSVDFAKPVVCVDTEYAVAELCAAVQAMPDSDPRKRRLIQRFNASNGGLGLAAAHPGVQQVSPSLFVVAQSGQKAANVGAGHRPNMFHSSAVKPLSSAADCSPSAGRAFAAGGFGGASSAFVRRYTKPSGVTETSAGGQTAAARAAMTIRSSLRRKLAIRGNISVPYFCSPTSSKQTLLETTAPPLLLTTDEERPFTTASLASGSVRHDGELCLDADGNGLIDSRNAEAAGSSSSIGSTASCDSMLTTVEMTLCCPLVEALASPFRRLAGDRSANASSSTGHSAARSHNSSSKSSSGHGVAASGKRGRSGGHQQRQQGNEASAGKRQPASRSGICRRPFSTVQLNRDLMWSTPPPALSDSTGVVHSNPVPAKLARLDDGDSSPPATGDNRQGSETSTEIGANAACVPLDLPTAPALSDDSFGMEHSQIMDGVYFPVSTQMFYSPHMPMTMNSFARVVRCSSVGDFRTELAKASGVNRSVSVYDKLDIHSCSFTEH